jgi:hypothetical protein
MPFSCSGLLLRRCEPVLAFCLEPVVLRFGPLVLRLDVVLPFRDAPAAVFWLEPLVFRAEPALVFWLEPLVFRAEPALLSWLEPLAF